MNPFRMAPVMVMAMVLTAVLSAACGGSGGDEEATAPEPSAIGSYSDRHEFREFAGRLDDALADGDLQFFLDNVSFSDVACEEGSPAPPAACTGKPAGAVVPGILVGVWESQDFYLDADGYEQFMREFLAESAEGSGDTYGGPEARLYAYAAIRPEFRFAPAAEETMAAIATRIPPERNAEREALLLTVGFDGERWAVTQLVVGPATFLDPAGPRAPGEAAGETIFQFWSAWEETSR